MWHEGRDVDEWTEINKRSKRLKKNPFWWPWEDNTGAKPLSTQYKTKTPVIAYFKGYGCIFSLLLSLSTNML